jgi:hypothetical protein
MLGSKNDYIITSTSFDGQTIFVVNPMIKIGHHT